VLIGYISQFSGQPKQRSDSRSRRSDFSELSFCYL